MTTNEILRTDSTQLYVIADGLRQDAKTLWEAGSKDEAMRLFRLFRRIVEELHRRRNPALAHLWN